MNSLLPRIVPPAALILLIGGVLIARPRVSSSAQETSQAQEAHLDVRDVVGHAKMSLTRAIEVALQAQPGKAVEAELEGEPGEDGSHVFFEVMVVAADGLYEVKLDPQSGALLERSKAVDAEELEELRDFQEVLRHTELTLSGMVSRAESILKGTAVAASLDMEDGTPECEVSFVNARYLMTAVLEGRAGHLVDLELVRANNDEDDHQQGDDDEDDEDEDDEDED